jgi:diguanylate cyclase (GGDEF)-like protein/PAS domain S-box-containing protein
MQTSASSSDAIPSAALSNAQQRLTDLIDAIDGIVWEADASTFSFTFVSRQTERILGYRAEEWYAEGFWPAHIHPDDCEQAVLFCHTQTKAGLEHTFEYRMLTHDGRVVWLKDSVSVVMRDGVPATLRGIMIDITEHKLAQQAADERLHFLQQLGDAIPSPIFWKDGAGRYQGCNKAFEEYIGIPRVELAGKSVYDIAPPELAAAYAAADNDLFRTRGTQTYEAKVRYYDGTDHDVAFYKATFSQTDGSLGGLVGVMLDITHRKRGEDMLRLSGTVFENSPQGILVTDDKLRILRVNRTFCEITGYEVEEVVGKTPNILQSGRHDTAFYETMWQSIKEDGAWSGEVWNRRKSGEVYTEYLSIIRVPDSSSEAAKYIGLFYDISHFKAAQMQIEQMSYFDAMTGLPNRALLNDRLQHALLNADRHNTRLALLSIDLDRLAHINDTLGHHIGDMLLKAVATRLSAAMRAADTLSRHIGDEFAVILEDLQNSQMAAELAERLLEELVRPFRIEGRDVSISACIGISVFPDDGKTPQMLLKHADVALHHAKESGEGSFQFFREEMNHASMERLQIESSLRKGLQSNEFRVHYQPQVELASGRIIGMEALIRWQHPDMGMVPPCRFIPIAEETGIVTDIGHWVLHEACLQTRRWHHAGYPHLRVAVNVSARQFNQDDFALQVRQILHDTGIAPDRLELELTESMIMQRPERVVAVMADLRALGVKFSIDDFGTGYSSLSQLKHFPIDKLKIDQSFIRDIGNDASSTAIARAIIALGRSMHLSVVAEGVETTSQQRFLVDCGCHSMQGFLFSRPLPADEFSALLARHTPVAQNG